MCDIICDVINWRVEATIWAKSIYMIKYWLETRTDKMWK